MLISIVLSVIIKSVLLLSRIFPTMSANVLQPKIVGGSGAEICDFPHQVFYIVYGENKIESFCSGSIYKDNVIITAAHCLIEVGSLENIAVFAGLTHCLTHNSDGNSVQKLILHEHYGKHHADENDIALLILENRLKFGSNVQPIELPEQDEVVRVGVRAMVSGWGSTYEHGPISFALLYTNVTVISNDDCQQAYGSRIANDSLCAGDPNGGKDACQGDSGGPLIYEKKLIGIVSYGNGCGKAGYPGVYARVSYFRHWINEHVAPYVSLEVGNIDEIST